MLRLYKPIDHDIFKLHGMLEHLVCSVWCEADDSDCEPKLSLELKKVYHYSFKKDVSFKDEIVRIYEIFKDLPQLERCIIRLAFKRNNKIEQLCNKDSFPIYLNDMHKVVENDIRPLFEWCYTYLLDQTKVIGDKLLYYKDLILENNFLYCPCCGLIDFESPEPENERRESNDHYLPKSKYPFASVNFKNLVPLCYKCNSDRKGAKDPIEDKREAFYPFSNGEHNISIKFEIDKNKDIDSLNRTDFEVNFEGDLEKIETWDYLFEISVRYSDKVRPRIKTFLRELKGRYRMQKKHNAALTFIEIIDSEIELYEDDKYSDWKFLKIPLLRELKQMPDLIEVFDD